MSSATYPLGMKTSNNHVLTGGYKTWKGTGLNSNPVATTAGNIPPYTNKDYDNTTIYKHGLPRPLKWSYRKGTTIQINRIIVDPNDNTKFIEISPRKVRSSVSSSLIGQIIDRPGQYTVKENYISPCAGVSCDGVNIDEINVNELDINNLDPPCTKCKGIGLVTTYYPNKNYITENPIPATENSKLCCNAERKARRMVRPASTNLSKRYYTTHEEYMYNRCQTYEQRVFNFYKGSTEIDPTIGANVKPGSPLSISNFYVAQCYPNTDYEPNLKGCKRVIYKPNNFQFAVEGGVESSLRTLKLGLTTIEKSVAQNRRGYKNAVANVGGQTFTPFIYKSKVQKCNPAYYTKNGNPRTCNKNTNDIIDPANSIYDV